MTRAELAKLITKLESSRDDLFEQGLKELEEFHNLKPALRIGICGSPGAGKSSLIEVLGLELLKKGKKLAVLAVDPTSPVTGGSILGDKTRMEKLTARDDVFIRPSPSKKSIGGIAEATDHVAMALEAAAYDSILVETVGVGQAEYSIADVVDMVVYIHLPNSGDELQGSKKGILEICDAICIHKADLNETAAKVAKSELESAFHFGLSENYATTRLFLTSSVTNLGIKELCDFICADRNFEKRRIERKNKRIEKFWQREVLNFYKHNDEFKKIIEKHDVSFLTLRKSIMEFLLQKNPRH